MKIRNISIAGLIILAGVLALLLFPILPVKSGAVLESLQPDSDVDNPASVAAAGPLFNYQGELRNAAGAPITNASLPMTFRLYKAATGGSACWTENRNVNVQNGQFNVVLGQVTTIPSSCVTGDAHLELVINGETLSPRELLTGVASAVVANTLTANSTALGSLTVPGTLTGNDVKANGSLWANNDLVLGNPNSGYLFHSRWNSNNDFLQITSTSDGQNWKWGQGITLVNATGNVGIGTNAPQQRLDVNGHTLVRGNLNLQGTCTRTSLNHYDYDPQEGPEAGIECQPGSIISGAYIEANLMLPHERNADEVTRFERGDLLCWSPEDQQLELCVVANNRLVMAVADANGKPIVLGAEPVKVVGPVVAGDLLVSSDVPGHAMVNNDPLPGTVIGQALEDFDGGVGLIKAMIRKW